MLNLTAQELQLTIHGLKTRDDYLSDFILKTSNKILKREKLDDLLSIRELQLKFQNQLNKLSSNLNEV